MNLLIASRASQLIFLLVLFAANLTVGYGQVEQIRIDRDRGHTILKAIKNDLVKSYYDGSYHGLDLDARFKAADDKINEVTSIDQIFGIIAQTLIELNDSHTFFLPPERADITEYGWQMRMIGNKCFVVAVQPGSDAEAKGLKEGDQIYAIDRFQPTRETLWKIQYVYNLLSPKGGMHLYVIRPSGDRVQFDVLAKITERKRVVDLTWGRVSPDAFDLIRESENHSRLNRQRYIQTSDTFVWKMPSFTLDESKVDDMADKFKNSKAVVFDLRGNGGGYESALLRLVGNLFDHDVKIGDMRRRKENKPVTAKARGKNPFAGKVIVLIDSDSGSAAELFARVVQLEKRGTVIGDQSAGAVMRSMVHGHQTGLDIVVPYAVSVTDADIVMVDGKSLEQNGVKPDELKLPTANDLAAKRDPVLAYALSLLNVTITPEEAGALFPIEWRK
jgi:C-terminal processing protease CtpA/Prc